VNVSAGNSGRGSPLHHAAKWGYRGCMELLLEHGADPNAQDGMWRTPLMLAARYAKSPQHVMGRLLEAGAQVGVVGCEQRTALHYAAARGLNVQASEGGRGREREEGRGRDGRREMDGGKEREGGWIRGSAYRQVREGEGVSESELMPHAVPTLNFTTY
jgi:hypothetical protein